MSIQILRKTSADSDFIYLSEAYDIGIHSMNPDENKLVCYSKSLEAANRFCDCLEQALELDIPAVEQKGDEYFITLPFQFSF